MSKINKKAVRFSYEQVLDTTARLASYAGANPLLNADTVNERQDDLAISDLVLFALHARRLIEDTDQKKIALASEVTTGSKDIPFLSIWRLLGIIIHNKHIELVRTEFQLRLRITDKERVFEDLQEHFFTNPYLKPLKPIVIIKSDTSEMTSFKLKEFIQIFAEKVLDSIIEEAERHGLYFSLDSLDD